MQEQTKNRLSGRAYGLAADGKIVAKGSKRAMIAERKRLGYGFVVFTMKPLGAPFGGPPIVSQPG